MSDEPENVSLEFGPEQNGRHEFVRRAWTIVIILASVGGAVLLLWLASQIILLLFAGILLAIFFRTLGCWVERFTHLPNGWALTLVMLFLFVLVIGGGWLLANPASEQLQQLSQEVPKALSQLQKQIEQYDWGTLIVDQLRRLTVEMGPVVTKVSGFFSVTVESVVGVLIILFLGIYFAADPWLYVNGFLRLLPRHRRARAQQVLNQIGTQLKHWILGQFITMAMVGLLTWVGLALLRVPLPGVLGTIAGVLDFIPVVGPWIAGILAALLGMLVRPILVVYVSILFVGIHLLESHLLIPQVQKYSTRLPPVLTILALALFTKWFGFLGLFLATPLMVVVLVLVQTFYQEDVLKDPNQG